MIIYDKKLECYYKPSSSHDFAYCLYSEDKDRWRESATVTNKLLFTYRDLAEVCNERFVFEQ